MDNHTRTSPKVSASRRTIIRAGFAVPTLATVASGSALAASSATCFARQMARPTYPAVTTSAQADKYLRVELGKFIKSGGGPATYYVDGSTLMSALGSTLTKSTSYTMAANKFQPFDTSTNTESGPAVTSTPSNGRYVKAGGRFAALRFDTAGKVVGVGAATTSGTSAVQLSCWSSLAP